MRLIVPVSLVSRLVPAKLGRCAKCWRLSFRGAVLGWIATAAVYLIGPQFDLWSHIGNLSAVMLIWPLSFTALWLLHIVTYGVRVLMWQSREHGQRPGEKRDLEPYFPGAAPLQKSGASSVALAAVAPVALGSPLARGKVFGVFAKSAMFVVLASASLSAPASAQSCDCDGKQSCCNYRETPVCWFCPNTSVFACCASGVTHCCNNDGPWCCPGDCGGSKGTCR